MGMVFDCNLLKMCCIENESKKDKCELPLENNVQELHLENENKVKVIVDKEWILKRACIRNNTYPGGSYKLPGAKSDDVWIKFNQVKDTSLLKFNGFDGCNYYNGTFEFKPCVNNNSYQEISIKDL